MSNHDYDGCHDQACDLCAAYAAGKDKARGELGQPDAALIFSEIQTRRNGKRWHNNHGYDFHKQGVRAGCLRFYLKAFNCYGIKHFPSFSQEPFNCYGTNIFPRGRRRVKPVTGLPDSGKELSNAKATPDTRANGHPTRRDLRRSDSPARAGIDLSTPIAQYRNASGAFSVPQQLAAVRGVGDEDSRGKLRQQAVAARRKPLITLDSPANGNLVELGLVVAKPALQKG